jgi:hypothetical protein
MFSLFLISYLVTSATAQTNMAPMGQPGNLGMPRTGMASTGTLESSGISG